MRRRDFLHHSLATAAGAAAFAQFTMAHAELTLPGVPNLFPPPKKKYRAGVIGSTGKGDYGHGLDVVMRNTPGVELVAIADDNPQGLMAAGKKLGVDPAHQYNDYHEMFAKEKLDLVSVAPRWAGQRESMITAAADAGCHIFCEKPFVIDVAMIDRVLPAIARGNVKVAVAHQNRVTPGVTEVRKMLADGRLGKVLSMQARGKEDARAGGQDMSVLGDHMFDLMQLLGGEPQWCMGDVQKGGLPVVIGDQREGDEQVGLVAGDNVLGVFGFPEGATGSFASNIAAKGEAEGQRFGLMLNCTKGVVWLRGSFDAFLLNQPAFNPTRKPAWSAMGPEGWQKLKQVERSDWCNVQLVLDLLHAVEDDRQPLASATAAAKAVEMRQAVYASHLAGKRLRMPLIGRHNPFSKVLYRH